MKKYIDGVAAHFQNRPIALEQEYQWPINNPVCFKKTFEHRQAQSQLFNEHAEQRSDIALKMVRDWGGIRQGGDGVKAMATESAAQLMKRGFCRVASWSKVITLHDPEKYLIYDARVAFSLNYVLWLSGVSEDFFPRPESRNPNIKKAVNALASKGVRFGRSRTVRGRNFYCQYLELVHAVSARLTETPPWQVEMALFARGPVLAEELVATSQSRKG